MRKVKILLSVVTTCLTMGSLYAQSATWSPMMGSPEYLCLMPQGGGKLLSVGAGNTTGLPNGNSGYYDGFAWSILQCPQGSHTLRTMSGLKPNDIYAGGDGGAIVHYDGTNWVSPPTPVTFDIKSMLVPYNGYVWVFGGSSFYRFNNGAWSNNTIPGFADCRCSWGNSHVVVAGGGSGCATTPTFTYNWQLASPQGSHAINSIWGSDEYDIYAVGDQGTIMHFNGTAWTLLPSMTTKSLRSVWGTSPYDVYIVGDNGEALYYDGWAWHEDFMPAGSGGAQFTSVTGSADRVFASGPGHPVMERPLPTSANVLVYVNFAGWVGPSLPPITVSVDNGPRITAVSIPTSNQGGYIDVSCSVNSNHIINIGAPGYKRAETIVTVGHKTVRIDFGGANPGLIPGDVNNDGIIDDTDILSVINHFLSTTYRPADLNGDSIIDDTDLLAVINHFLQ